MFQNLDHLKSDYIDDIALTLDEDVYHGICGLKCVDVKEPHE
jgi:hypothetical protein